jgi:hypothetical protein
MLHTLTKATCRWWRKRTYRTKISHLPFFPLLLLTESRIAEPRLRTLPVTNVAAWGASESVASSHQHPRNWITVACKTWGFHGGDYEECCLLGYKNPVRTSQKTHYVSIREFSQLMLCKIWGLHGGDYEECRLLEYNNPVRTSQEIHYVSATESSRLMLCKIWGFDGGDYEESHLLGCYAVWSLYGPTFRRNLAPPSFCHPEDGGAKFLRNVGSYKGHTA